MTTLTIQQEKPSLPTPGTPPPTPAAPAASTAPPAPSAPAAPPAPPAPSTPAALSAPPALSAPAAPHLTTTVPREYVHRSSHAEVFLTGCHRHTDTHFTLTGQWPRTHTFFTTPDRTSHDPLQAAETIRQTGLYLAHAQFGVPLDHHFLMWNIHLTTHPEHMTIHNNPSELTLTAHLTHTRKRGPHLTEFTLHITITRQGHPCATGGGRFTCLTPATYQRLRKHTTHTPEHHRTHHPRPTPTTLGKHHPFDIVLAPTHQPHHWLLNPDPRHPILFDHTTDHYPGMILLEAARQATHALLHPTPHTLTHTTAHFHHYAEYHTPCHITATHTSTNDPNSSTSSTSSTSSPSPSSTPTTATINITATQNTQTIFTAHITTTPTPPPH
ncbi:ScbA/BarX family gamma-butyrolactone biosynthesis protein [Streptomyces sp. NPDC086787]|uniref:ScbA/BarX family gamma-butyrolactone biosynthesis protein n=1 Tax=Streptomyces sp. NPDC086787 TaxID=3365759 RepID=UPI0038144073